MPCPHCGVSFRPGNLVQKYCTPLCRKLAANARAHTPAAHKACLECGGMFETNRPAKVYCTPTCQNASEVRRLRHLRHQKPTTVVCPGCSKQFERMHQNQMYCTPACQRRRGAPPPEPCACAICRKVFMPIRRDAKVCSEACRIERQVRYERILQARRRETLDAAFGDA